MSDNRTHEDAFDLLCGDLIASGTTRHVFGCRLQTDLVVKVEIIKDWRTFENVKEFNVWQFYSNNEGLKWLAPCKAISPDGRILLQKRCDPLPTGFELPEKLPYFLNDLKPENFGIYQGRLVCLDYALTYLQASMRMEKAKWRV